MATSRHTESRRKPSSTAPKPRLWIGTSGWVYKHWNGLFYPPGLSSREQLPFYAKHYDTVEVNFSFYRLPERSVFESWWEQSPRDFLFAVKGSRYLTHMKKLKDPEEPLERLINRAEGLKEKLGPILFQFPYTWAANIGRLDTFLGYLRSYRRHRFAFEFRHQTWLSAEVYRLLERADAALCLPVGPGVPLDPRLTASFSYIRFHAGAKGIGFKKRELDLWAHRIRSFTVRGADVFAYFNNDAEGHALKDANRLREILKSRKREGRRS